MIRERVDFDAVLLGDGTVLAVGDSACDAAGASDGSERAELYDPITDTWTEVESLNKPRESFATVPLRDGTALVAGGYNAEKVPFSSTRVFDASSRTWRDGDLLQEARAYPVMTTLADGRALILGGYGVGHDFSNYLSTAEIYDPSSSSWTGAAALPARVRVINVISLTDGRALAVGFDLTDSEPVPTAMVFDPARNMWTRIDGSRYLGYELVPTRDGGALALGGVDGGELFGGNGSIVDLVSRLDPESGGWAERPPMSTPRIGSQATVLPDGRVLVAGGAIHHEFLIDESGFRFVDIDKGRVLSSAEVFDPSIDRWTPVGNLLEPRKYGNLIVLADGSVLLMGGNASPSLHEDVDCSSRPLSSVERFYPGP
ncbi:MAG TPA: kelch repeat-containing protein [Candidatus Limnocylindrales bacterium]|nr:kelch repeat-containing protein [Candidatus Limnocylindrales bacterium]